MQLTKVEKANKTKAIFIEEKVKYQGTIWHRFLKRYFNYEQGLCCTSSSEGPLGATQVESFMTKRHRDPQDWLTSWPLCIQLIKHWQILWKERTKTKTLESLQDFLKEYNSIRWDYIWNNKSSWRRHIQWLSLRSLHTLQSLQYLHKFKKLASILYLSGPCSEGVGCLPPCLFPWATHFCP